MVLDEAVRPIFLRLGSRSGSHAGRRVANRGMIHTMAALEVRGIEYILG